MGLLSTSGGTFELRAKSLTVTATGVIQSASSATTNTGFTIDATGNVSVLGQLRAENGIRGSKIEIVSDGNIDLGGNVDPVVKGDGNSTGADGAEISISAGGSVHVYRPIWMSGKSGGTDANSNLGGDLEVSAGGDIQFHGAANVTACGRHYGGGTVSLEAAGTVRADSTIAFDGQTPDAFGGELEIVAGNAVFVVGTLYGPGGSNYGGGQGAGGSVTIRAGCGGINISGTVDVSAGEEDGGEVTVFSDGHVTISGTINASSVKNGGKGGFIAIEAGKVVTVTLSSTLKANGHASASSGIRAGGNIQIVGCQAWVADSASAGARIESTGKPGGLIAIEGHKSPLTAGVATDYSLKVGNLTTLTAAGLNGGNSGAITLSTKVSRSGWCQNQASRVCQLNSECIVSGVNVGPCIGANPDKEGVSSQFTPAAIALTVPSYPSCSAVCP